MGMKSIYILVRTSLWLAGAFLLFIILRKIMYG